MQGRGMHGTGRRYGANAGHQRPPIWLPSTTSATAGDGRHAWMASGASTGPEERRRHDHFCWEDSDSCSRGVRPGLRQQQRSRCSLKAIRT